MPKVSSMLHPLYTFNGVAKLLSNPYHFTSSTYFRLISISLPLFMLMTYFIPIDNFGSKRTHYQFGISNHRKIPPQTPLDQVNIAVRKKKAGLKLQAKNRSRWSIRAKFLQPRYSTRKPLTLYTETPYAAASASSLSSKLGRDAEIIRHYPSQHQDEKKKRLIATSSLPIYYSTNQGGLLLRILKDLEHLEKEKKSQALSLKRPSSTQKVAFCPIMSYLSLQPDTNQESRNMLNGAENPTARHKAVALTLLEAQTTVALY